MLSPLDSFLNKTTMYRLVLYYLLALLVFSAGMAAFGALPFTPFQLVASTAFLVAASILVNRIIGFVLKAPINPESAWITGLILALIMNPDEPAKALIALFVAAAAAMICKYLFALNKAHVFNPAAFGALIAGLIANDAASWWIGGSVMVLPLTLVGFLIVKKIRRWDLVMSFLVATAIASVLPVMLSGKDGISYLISLFEHTPLFFFAFVMLTEPLTTPPITWMRIAYGAIVGVLSAPWVHFGSYYGTPELALLVGNVVAYVLHAPHRYKLTLVRVDHVADSTADYVFSPNKPIKAEAGQYVEWTLPHAHYDDRSVRRYFTLASSPTETEVHLGVKFYSPPSTFKKALDVMKPGESIYVHGLAGDFTLPADPTRKLVFIAGGIGVTPFRSMAKYITDKNELRDVVMLYAVKSITDIAYRDVFTAASTHGMKTLYVVANGTGSGSDMIDGTVDGHLISERIPDFKNRSFYISGPHAMVEGISGTLRKLGVSRSNIHTDYFPGFA